MINLIVELRLLEKNQSIFQRSIYQFILILRIL
jgi:hypothetical protein